MYVLMKPKRFVLFIEKIFNSFFFFVFLLIFFIIIIFYFYLFIFFFLVRVNVSINTKGYLRDGATGTILRAATLRM